MKSWVLNCLFTPSSVSLLKNVNPAPPPPLEFKFWMKHWWSSVCLDLNMQYKLDSITFILCQIKFKLKVKHKYSTHWAKTDTDCLFSQGSVLPSIHKACWPCKPSGKIFRLCVKVKSLKLWCDHRPCPNHALPSSLELFLGRTLQGLILLQIPPPSPPPPPPPKGPLA